MPKKVVTSFIPVTKRMANDFSQNCQKLHFRRIQKIGSFEKSVLNWKNELLPEIFISIRKVFANLLERLICVFVILHYTKLRLIRIRIIQIFIRIYLRPSSREDKCIIIHSLNPCFFLFVLLYSVPNEARIWRISG